MATSTISWVDWFFGTNGVFGAYKRKKKEETDKTLINGLDTGLRLKLDQISSIRIDGVTYDITFDKKLSLTLKERNE